MQSSMEGCYDVHLLFSDSVVSYLDVCDVRKFSHLVCMSPPKGSERGKNVVREPPTTIDPDFGCIAITPPTKKYCMEKGAFITNVWAEQVVSRMKPIIDQGGGC